MGSLIVGIIGAAVAGVTAFAGSLWDDARSREQAAAYKEYLEKVYALKKKEAKEKFEAAKEQANRNAKQQELEADLTDQSLDITEQGLSNDFNAAIDNMYLSQESDAMSWNAQSMQMGSSEGAAYANLAASGVRSGSSLDDAVLMESAVNESQLQFSQDAKRRSDSNNLASVLNGLAGNKFAIQQGRIGADVSRDNAQYLRQSYEKGGHNYNLYKNELEMLKTNVEYDIDKANYEYEQHSGWNAFWNSFMALNSGSKQGFQTGYNTYNTIYNGLKKE